MSLTTEGEFHATSVRRRLLQTTLQRVQPHFIYVRDTNIFKTCHRETKYIRDVEYLESLRTIPQLESRMSRHLT